MWRALAVAIGIAFSLAPVAAKADAGLVLFQNNNFGGRGIGVTGDVRDLGRSSFSDMASSVHVNSGKWLLCEHANFEGRCITVDRDVRDLGQLGFNDKVTSVRRIDDRDGRNGYNGRDDNRRGDVTVFADANYSGESKTYNDDVRDFHSTGFNDRISSIRIRRGSWQLCENANYRGRCIVVKGDLASFGKYGFNDKISSMRRVR
jgi:hypothetical protein